MRIALDNAEQLEVTPTAQEWEGLMEMSAKQGVMGVMFCGVEKLPHEQKPPIEVIMDWSAVVDHIERENRMLNAECVKVCNAFNHEGKKICVLKGQGMSVLYPQPLRRSTGDIDVWMEGGKDKVFGFVRSKFKDASGSEEGHHLSATLKSGIHLEVHHVPAKLDNPFNNRKLSHFFTSVESTQWNNWVGLPDGIGEIHVPSRLFNLVFILVHLFHHWAFEGCGMKQVLDYYWLLKDETVFNDGHGSHNEAMKVLKQIGLKNFTAAIMSIFQQWGLRENQLLCKPNKKLGELLLKDILETGIVSADELSSGKYGHENKVHKFGRRLERVCRMMTLAPSELPWGLLKNILSWMLGKTK